MAFDLDDEELKATREMPCNKKQYNFKKMVQEDKAEEASEVLKELEEVRPEMLNDKAKRLFEAIMKIADDRDKAESDLYEANNCISDLLDIIKYKEKIIDKMLDTLIGLDSDIEIVRQNARINTKEKKAEVLKMYEIKCNDK